MKKGQKGDNGQKGEQGVGIKGQKGEDNSTKGQKGEDNSTKGQKGETGSSGTDASLPVGTIVAYGGNSAPSGWQLCNGGTTATSALQSVLGQSTVPDLRDRFVVGAGNSYNRHNTGGSSSVTLTTSQLPSHTHGDGSLSASNTSITGNVTKVSECYNVAGGATGVFSKYNTGNSPVTGSSSNSPTAGFSMDASHTHDVTGSTGSTGSGNSHENRPPYYALVYIIKT